MREKQDTYLKVCGEIQQMLIDEGRTLSTAESCTGGRLASAITAIAGSSAYFQGALVAYQNEIKTKLLKVKEETIRRYDVVSREVVCEMVRGACSLFGTDYAIATSGYAGPGGGSDKVPQGTIWLAYGSPDNIQTHCLTDDKGRIANVEFASMTVLEDFLSYLKKTKSST